MATSLQQKRKTIGRADFWLVLLLIISWTGSLVGFGQEQGQMGGKKVLYRALDLPRLPSTAGAARNHLRRQKKTAESFVGQNFA